MVKKTLLLMTFSLLSCNSIADIEIKLEKRIINFNQKNFPQLQFNKLYLLDGTYYSKPDFQIISPKLEIYTNGNYYEYLYIKNNGKVFFLTSPKKYIENPDMNNDSNFSGVIYKESNDIFIERKQLFKMRGGVWHLQTKINGN